MITIEPGTLRQLYPEGGAYGCGFDHIIADSRLVFALIPDIPFWIAGGACREWYEDRPPNDLDIFVSDAEHAEQIAKQLGGDELYRTPNRIGILRGGIEFDIVRREFPTPTDTLNTFDFTCCACAVSRDGTITYDARFPEDCSTRRLRAGKIVYPVASVKRYAKFIKQGYEMSDADLTKFVDMVQKADIEKVLY